MYKSLVSEAAISSALYTLRVRTIREGRPGLEHVEALLALRGDNLTPIPIKRTIRFRKGELRRLVLRALRERPMKRSEIVAAVYVGRDMPPVEQASNRVGVILTRLKRDGVVRSEGRVWRLAP